MHTHRYSLHFDSMNMRCILVYVHTYVTFVLGIFVYDFNSLSHATSIIILSYVGYQTLQATAFNPIIQENNKLQDEKNKLLTAKNALESELNTLQADVVVFQQRIDYLQGEEQNVYERNISLEAEIKRLKNKLADGQQVVNPGPEVFFGFTRTEMAQVCTSCVILLFCIYL